MILVMVAPSRRCAGRHARKESGTRAACRARGDVESTMRRRRRRRRRLRCCRPARSHSSPRRRWRVGAGDHLDLAPDHAPAAASNVNSSVSVPMLPQRPPRLRIGHLPAQRRERGDPAHRRDDRSRCRCARALGEVAVALRARGPALDALAPWRDRPPADETRPRPPTASSTTRRSTCFTIARTLATPASPEGTAVLALGELAAGVGAVAAFGTALGGGALIGGALTSPSSSPSSSPASSSPSTSS